MGRRPGSGFIGDAMVKGDRVQHAFAIYVDERGQACANVPIDPDAPNCISVRRVQCLHVGHEVRVRISQPRRPLNDRLHSGDIGGDHHPVVLVVGNSEALALAMLDAPDRRAQAEIDAVRLQVCPNGPQQRRVVIAHWVVVHQAVVVAEVVEVKCTKHISGR